MKIGLTMDNAKAKNRSQGKLGESRVMRRMNTKTKACRYKRTTRGQFAVKTRFPRFWQHPKNAEKLKARHDQ